MTDRQSILNKWLAAPTGLELALGYALLGMYSVLASEAVIPFGWIGFVTVSLDVAGLLVVLRLLLLVIAVLRRTCRPAWGRWAQLAVMVCLGFVILETDLPLVVRVRFSEWPLLEEVRSIRQMRPEILDRILKSPPHPVGLFQARVWRVSSEGAVIWFHTADGECAFPPPFSFWGGVVYCEGVPPPEMSETAYRHLYGPWWRWVQDT